MTSVNLVSNAHYDVTNERLVEPIKEITITTSATNPGGSTTLWIRASDGALMLGANPISSGAAAGYNPKARISLGGNYSILQQTNYTPLTTPAGFALFYNFGISPGLFTNPSPGIIKYNGLVGAQVRILFAIVAQTSGAAQTFEVALSKNGATTSYDYYYRPPVDSSLPITINLDTDLATGEEFGFAYKLSAGSGILIREFYFYVEIIA
jgi:hypothetical protein